MKKILFLGAAAFQLPPIQYALAQGHYVITTDNCPENVGHQLAHKTYNISTIDKEAVLEMAKMERVDGVVCYASDVSAPTAAYVCEKMNLSGTNYETSIILTNKAVFRQFLQKHQLQEQDFRHFTWQEKTQIGDYLQNTALPVVVKPVDASGSKGVAIIHHLKNKDWEIKVANAFRRSLSSNIIIETYIEKEGRQLCGDGYMEDGRLHFIAFGDGHFYENQQYLAPYAETFPSINKENILNKVKKSLERILQKASYPSGPFNFDVLLTKGGGFFVNEIGPRCGGNFLPMAIQLISNIDLTAAAVELSLDANYKLDINKNRSPFFFACYMIHSLEKGHLKAISFEKSIEKNIIKRHPFVEMGEEVLPFYQANHALGNIILCFDSYQEMMEKMERINELCRVELENYPSLH